MRQFLKERFTNMNARLVWHDSYLLRGMILSKTIFPEKREELDALIRLWVKGIINTQDIHVGVTDYNGMSDYGWSCNIYSDNGEPIRYLLHSGIIGSAILEAVMYLPESDSVRIDVLSQMKNLIETFQREWYQKGEERYEFPRDIPESRVHGIDGIPVNHEAAWIEFLARYQDITRTHDYDKFIKNFQYKMNLIQKWTYYWKLPGYNNSIKLEDIPHAAIVLKAVAYIGWEKFPQFLEKVSESVLFQNSYYTTYQIISHFVNEDVPGSNRDYLALYNGWNLLPTEIKGLELIRTKEVYIILMAKKSWSSFDLWNALAYTHETKD
ncbi:MAG: hypothetical protein H8D45_26410 [Bacteroidetes bacterium]|nr:hypothetical protein [Bacteroidota bacterium]MBL7136977.1 hypothetical protein [Candidatus Neomarinimicrobiota bacterium]